MNDFILGSSLLGAALSSFHLGSLGNPLRYSGLLPRIIDNVSILGKILATFLSLLVLVLSGNMLFLASTLLHALSLYFFSKKTALKGKLFVWATPYDMPSWDQRSLDSSRTSIISASSTLIANVMMLAVGVYLYRNGS